MKRRVTQSVGVSAMAGGSAKIKRSRGDRSAVKRLMSLLHCGADTRIKKVKRIRQAVRACSYENELKLSVAMDRLERELAG